MNGRALTDDQKDAVLRAVGEAWKTSPELRLGQMLAVWMASMWGDGNPGSIAARGRMLDGLFFIEDGDLAHTVGMLQLPGGRGLHGAALPGRLAVQAGPACGKEGKRSDNRNRIEDHRPGMAAERMADVPVPDSSG